MESFMDQQKPFDGDHPDAAEMEDWVVAASAWGEAAQGLVGAAADLALASRSLADTIDSSDNGRPEPAEARRDELRDGLRTLGNEVEGETEELRDRMLQTSANLAEYGQVLG